MKKLSILLFIVSLVGVVAGAILYKTNKVLGFILLVISLIIMFAYAIIEDRAKKKDKNEFMKQSKIDELETNKQLEIHAFDNNVTTVIYKLFKGELVELSDLINNSDCFVEYDYDEEEHTYLVDICSIDLSKKNKDAFVIALYSSNSEQKLLINDSEEDVSNLEENEIIDKLVSAVNQKAKRTEVDEFVIKISKKQLIAFTTIFLLSLIGIVTFIILGAVEQMKWAAAISIASFSFLFTILSGLGLYSYFHEKLIYKNHIIKYIGLFKKPVSCKIEDVKSVVVEVSGVVRRIKFLDKNDHVLIKINDDGTVLSNKLFLKLLNKNNIKLALF